VVNKTLNPDDGGFVAVSRTGDIVMVFNSEGMFRGAADSSGRFDIAIWEGPR
jgi:isoaspartyl peptidase/L-asparaginase-like protein (Ntn-hydrolase superfamily)